MKNKILLLLLIFSIHSFSQELNLTFFEHLNSLSIANIKETLVDGYGFLESSENKYLHPKSNDQSNALLISVSDFQFKNKTRLGRQMEIICSNNLNLNTFKSELLDQGYEYQGKTNDPSIDLKYYKKGDDKEVAIFVISNGEIKKFQINFITRY